MAITPYTTPTAAEMPVGDRAIVSIAPSSNSRGRGTVLVVDDMPMNRLVLKHMVKKAGLDVVEAANGAECLEQVKHHPPGHFQCILMDLQMPIMDGWEAAQQVRAWEQLQSNPDTDAQDASPDADNSDEHHHKADPQKCTSLPATCSNLVEVAERVALAQGETSAQHSLLGTELSHMLVERLSACTDVNVDTEGTHMSSMSAPADAHTPYYNDNSVLDTTASAPACTSFENSRPSHPSYTHMASQETISTTVTSAAAIPAPLSMSTLFDDDVADNKITWSSSGNLSVADAQVGMTGMNTALCSFDVLGTADMDHSCVSDSDDSGSSDEEEEDAVEACISQHAEQQLHSMAARIELPCSSEQLLYPARGQLINHAAAFHELGTFLPATVMCSEPFLCERSVGFHTAHCELPSFLDHNDAFLVRTDNVFLDSATLFPGCCETQPPSLSSLLPRVEVAGQSAPVVRMAPPVLLPVAVSTAALSSADVIYTTNTTPDIFERPAAVKRNKPSCSTSTFSAHAMSVAPAVSAAAVAALFPVQLDTASNAGVACGSLVAPAAVTTALKGLFRRVPSDPGVIPTVGDGLLASGNALLASCVGPVVALPLGAVVNGGVLSRSLPHKSMLTSSTAPCLRIPIVACTAEELQKPPVLRTIGKTGLPVLSAPGTVDGFPITARSHALSCGMDDCVNKPVSFQDLCDLLHKYIPAWHYNS